MKKVDKLAFLSRTDILVLDTESSNRFVAKEIMASAKGRGDRESLGWSRVAVLKRSF